MVSVSFRAKAFGDHLLNQQDAINYIRTVFQSMEEIRSGILFPRILTYDLQGQGYPAFQFYPPCSFLAPAYLGVLLRCNPQLAINLAVALAYVAMGFSFVSVARILGIGRSASIVGAIALLTFPYLTHLSLLNTPMFFGLAAFLWLAASAARFNESPGLARGSVLFAATAALALTHFLSTVLYLGFLVVLVPYLAVASSPSILAVRLRKIGMTTAILILGIVACSFQLVPMAKYGLHGWLRINQLLATPASMADYARLYTTFSNLLSPRLSEANPLSPPFKGEYGFQLGLAYTLGFALCLHQLIVRPSARSRIAPLLLVVAGCVLLMNPEVIGRMPGIIGVFQFPTRFLGIVALPGALLLAFGVDPFLDGEPSANDAQPPLRHQGVVLQGLLCAGVMAVSSLATQYIVNEDSSGRSGFSNPVSLEQVLRDPSSTYSIEYALDSYHFAQKFPSERLYGGAQYFINYHQGYIENRQTYPFPPLDKVPAGVRLHLEGSVPEGIPLPQPLTVYLNGSEVDTLPISSRSFTADVAVPPSLAPLRTVAYTAPRSIEHDGRAMIVQINFSRFYGLPEEQSVRYWRDLPWHVKRKPPSFEAVLDDVPGPGIFVMPVLAYPGLQSASVNDESAAIMPVPFNDLVYCGVRLPPHGKAQVRIQFTGSRAANMASVAALAVFLAIGVLTTARRR